MGCGSGKDAIKRVEVSEPIQVSKVEQKEDVGVIIAHPNTRFVLSEAGNVEIVSMRCLIKYNPKEEQLESFVDQVETITSTLSWESQEDSITFTLKDEYVQNILTKKKQRIPEFPYQWMTTKDGHYVI